MNYFEDNLSVRADRGGYAGSADGSTRQLEHPVPRVSLFDRIIGDLNRDLNRDPIPVPPPMIQRPARPIQLPGPYPVGHVGTPANTPTPPVLPAPAAPPRLSTMLAGALLTPDEILEKKIRLLRRVTHPDDTVVEVIFEEDLDQTELAAMLIGAAVETAERVPNGL